MRRIAWTVLWSENNRLTRRQAAAFLCVLGSAIVACAASDGLLGAWRVQGGQLFPWRHLGGVPLYGHSLLVVEWLLGAVAGALLLARRRCDLAVKLALVATAMGISQRYSNHRALLLIVLVFVSLAPINLDVPGSYAAPRPAFGLVRAQLLLVYAFSVLNKMLSGFLAGDALRSLFAWHAARPIAWGVLLAEVAVPILLLVRPRWGIALAVVLHVSMAVVLPSVWPFSLTMIAMALLFLR
jgi:hypothetical protein